MSENPEKHRSWRTCYKCSTALFIGETYFSIVDASNRILTFCSIEHLDEYKREKVKD